MYFAKKITFEIIQLENKIIQLCYNQLAFFLAQISIKKANLF